MNINLLIAKIKVHFEKGTQNISNVHTVVELCAMRDGTANCDVIYCAEACKLIDLLSLEYWCLA